jgi:1,4-dihydroxy-2-naphthoate polyprenyltransferase
MNTEVFIQRDTQPPKRNLFKVWWRQLRPHTLTAAFVPVMIGSFTALTNSDFQISLFFAMLIASLLIQSATNLFNEYYDYKRGLDTEESVGIGGGIVRDGILPKTILNTAVSFFGIAILLGVYICMNSTWMIALIGSICMTVGYFYTGGPHPIAYTPFGELISGFFMGVVIILIAYFIQTGTVTTDIILLSIPSAILIGAIMMANNIRDLDGDKESGRKTLAILLGRDKAVTFLAWMFTISYLWIIGLIFVTPFAFTLLLVILSIPKAIKAIKLFRGKSIAVEMVPAMKATAQVNTIFGLLVVIGLLIQILS